MPIPPRRFPPQPTATERNPGPAAGGSEIELNPADLGRQTLGYSFKPQNLISQAPGVVDYLEKDRRIGLQGLRFFNDRYLMVKIGWLA